MSNSRNISTPLEPAAQSPTNSISRSPEEHRKHADERAQRALANLNRVGDQKAAEKAALMAAECSTNQAPGMNPELGADPELAANQTLPMNALPIARMKVPSAV